MNKPQPKHPFDASKVDPEVYEYLTEKRIPLNAGQRAFLYHMGCGIWVCHLSKRKRVLSMSGEGVQNAIRFLMDHGANSSVQKARKVQSFLAYARLLNYPEEMFPEDDV